MARSRRLCRLGDVRASQERRGARRKKLTFVLIWNLDWGESYQKIVSAARSVGVKLSELPCVMTKPEMAQHLLFEWTAFRDLSSDRFIGMDRGPIHWSSIDRYGRRFGVCGDEFERLARIIRALDESYLGYKKEGV